MSAYKLSKGFMETSIDFSNPTGDKISKLEISFKDENNKYISIDITPADFTVIGAGTIKNFKRDKAGLNALYHYLKDNPDIDEIPLFFEVDWSLSGKHTQYDDYYGEYVSVYHETRHFHGLKNWDISSIVAIDDGDGMIHSVTYANHVAGRWPGWNDPYLGSWLYSTELTEDASMESAESAIAWDGKNFPPVIVLTINHRMYDHMGSDFYDKLADNTEYHETYLDNLI